MHTVLERVAKNFFNYWFNGKISCNYSLAKYMIEIDKRLLKIRPPKYIPSTPHTIYGVHMNIRILFYFMHC